MFQNNMQRHLAAQQLSDSIAWKETTCIPAKHAKASRRYRPGHATASCISGVQSSHYGSCTGPKVDLRLPPARACWHVPSLSCHLSNWTMCIAVAVFIATKFLRKVRKVFFPQQESSNFLRTYLRPKMIRTRLVKAVGVSGLLPLCAR